MNTCLLALLGLHLFAARPGDLAPLGAANACLDVGDAVVLANFAVGLPNSPTAEQIAVGDVAGKPGEPSYQKIDVVDVIAMLDAVVAKRSIGTPPCFVGCIGSAGFPFELQEATCDNVDNDCDLVSDEGCCVPGTSGCPCASTGCQAGLKCGGSTGTCQSCGLGCSCTTHRECASGLRCGASGACEPCAPGSSGCTCAANSACAGCDHCVDGRCTPDAALPGTLGCGCGSGDGCVAPLACVGTACALCPVGTVGCKCSGGLVQCESGSVCASGTCVPCSGTPCAACTPGKLGCICAAGAVCDGPFGSGTGSCVGGRCYTATTCPAGSLNCPCYGNQTCDPVQGIPVSCKAGRCDPTGAVPLGSLGAACKPGKLCGDFFGIPLACLGAKCVIDGCTAGHKGCECGSGLSCQSGLTCATNGICVSSGCVAGTSLCQCANGQCTGGLGCVGGVCAYPGAAVLSVSASQARGCDVLLEDTDDAAVISVQFAPDGKSNCATLGVFARRGHRVALSFICSDNKAMIGPQARLILQSAASTVADLTVLSTACYDTLGNSLPTAKVTWQ